MNAFASVPVIAVDIGNTNAKFFVYRYRDGDDRPEPERIIRTSTDQFTDEDWLENVVSEIRTEIPATQLLRWRVASVHRDAAIRLANLVASERPDDDYQNLTNRDVPMTINVQSPESVGVDRLLAAVGANFLREPSRPAILIDVGTAVTVNLVSADGVFQGGAIMPGFKLQASALSAKTDGLPMVDLSDGCQPICVVGKTTQAAIHNGLKFGIVGAIRELVERISDTVDASPEVFVTGGDMSHVESISTNDTQFVPDLVALGILLTARSLNEHDE